MNHERAQLDRVVDRPEEPEARRIGRGNVLLTVVLAVGACVVAAVVAASAGLWDIALVILAVVLVHAANLVWYARSGDVRRLDAVALATAMVALFLCRVRLSGSGAGDLVTAWAIPLIVWSSTLGKPRRIAAVVAAFLGVVVAGELADAVLPPRAIPGDFVQALRATTFAWVVAGAVIPVSSLAAARARLSSELAREHARSERLLLNVLPASIVARLKGEPGMIADAHPAASVLFADLVGFTALSADLPPEEVVAMLDRVFTRFDALAARYGLEKIKTIGDAYMVVGGVPVARPDHADAIARMALDMLDAVRDEPALSIRVGLHTGPVVAGVIGRSKFAYDLWGDTVNTASRMESHGAAGRIHLSAAARDALGEGFRTEERGPIAVKGKGEMVTYWLLGPGAGASTDTTSQSRNGSTVSQTS